MAKRTFEWLGHILASLVLLYSILYGSRVGTIWVSLLLGICYLGRVYVTRTKACLYTTVFLWSLTYFLLIENSFGIGSLVFFWLPPFFLIQLLGPDPLIKATVSEEAAPESAPGERWFAAPLVISSRVILAGLLCFIVFSQESIVNFYFIIVPLMVLAFYEVRQAVLRSNSWHLFVSALMFSGVYYFYLLEIIAGPTNLIMVLWAGFGLIFMLIAFILAHKGKEYAQGLFCACFVVATVAISVVLIVSIVENRIEPLGPQATASIQGQPVNESQQGVLSEAEETASSLVANRAGILVFFIAAIVFTLLRVKYDRNEFVFMLLLTLGLLAYFLIVLVEDPLYRSFVNYALYGLLVLGLLFSYVFVKEVLNFSWSLSDYLSGHYSRILYTFIPVALVFTYFLFDYTMAVTENAHFCGSCHIMKIQFDSWKQDKHCEKGVGCFDCHYSPGFANFIKGRTAGAVMVIKNFTGLYKAKFPANVSDRSCLQCHMDGTLQDTDKLESWITYKENIKFNHKVMVHQQVSGIELKCTSCHLHYQYRENAHLYVPEGVCYTCHLMKRREETGTAIGNCYTCHHLEDIEGDLENLVTIGTGDAPKEKCLHCHWEAKDYSNTTYQHKIHITDYQDFTKRGIACFDCHNRIEHGDLSTLLNASLP